MLIIFFNRLFRGVFVRPSREPKKLVSNETSETNSTGTELSPIGTTNGTDLEALPSTNATPRSSSLRTRYKPSTATMRNFTIGLADGMTVPFALTAGLSFAATIHTVILAGAAELVSGAISMGIGGYLGTRGELKAYRKQVAEIKNIISTNMGLAKCREIFQSYPGVLDTTIMELHRGLEKSPDGLMKFLMGNLYQIAESDIPNPLLAGLIIALGYLLGGILPLIPYLCVQHQEDKVKEALYISIGIMIVALLSFGCFKTMVEDHDADERSSSKAIFYGGLEMLCIGGAAVGVSMGIIIAINHNHGENGPGSSGVGI